MTKLERDRELLRERALGWSPACELLEPGVDLGRDLRLVDGDLARVSSIDNLTQSLSLALTTRLGDDLFNTEFGFDGLRALAEETNPTLVRERVRIAVISVLRKDPRVRRIVDVKLSGDRLDEVAAGGRTLDVRVLFETVSGDQVSINLGSVIPNA